MELIEMGELTEAQWSELADGELKPWGGEAEDLSWRQKERVLGLRERDGRLAAVAGSVTAQVRAGAAEPFTVLGIGGVFVTPSRRGEGLVGRLMGELLGESAQEGGGPEYAMLFCRAQLRNLYARLGFLELAATASALQPDGASVEVPMRAMWRPLRIGAEWPPGPVAVLGLPF